MGFVKKTWKDRLVEYAGRRKLTNVATGATQTVDVTRVEGTESQAGDMFNATNMNDLENRTYNAFNDVVKVYKNTSVAASAWGTYTAALDNEAAIIAEGYTYKADIKLSGIMADHATKVCFAPAEVQDGVFAGYVNSQAGKVRIYANSKPIAAITIPTIYAVKKGV